MMAGESCSEHHRNKVIEESAKRHFLLSSPRVWFFRETRDDNWCGRCGLRRYNSNSLHHSILNITSLLIVVLSEAYMAGRHVRGSIVLATEQYCIADALFHAISDPTLPHTIPVPVAWGFPWRQWSDTGLNACGTYGPGAQLR